MSLGNKFNAWVGKLVNGEKLEARASGAGGEKADSRASEAPPAPTADAGADDGGDADDREPPPRRRPQFTIQEIFEGIFLILQEIDARLESVTKIDGLVGMVQAVAKSGARSDKLREQQFLDLRADLTTEFDRLGASLRQDAARAAALDVFKALVGSLDDVDHVLRETAGADDARSAQSLRMIQRKMKDGFAKLGVEEILVEPKVTQFDAAQHEGKAFEGDAADVEGLAPGTVVRVDRAGYRAGGITVRPAVVSVVTES